VIHTRLLALDTAEQLRRRFFQSQIEVVLEAPDPRIAAAVEKLSFIKGLWEEGSRLVLELTDPEHNRPELVKAIVEAGGRVMSVNEKRYPLEEVYLKLIREDNVRDS
jgi:ABC-type multidrug transport system ATPase subunit